MEDTLIQLVIAVGPAVIVGVVAYYFFNKFIENEDGRRRYLLHKDTQASTLPTRLQAYERLALYLERIKPTQLLLRVKPTHTDKNSYEQALVTQIEQEFEHNLAQQIYLSDACWNIIKSAKNGTIKLIRSKAMQESISNADKLREAILRDGMDEPAPSTVALTYLKNEVKDLFG